MARHRAALPPKELHDLSKEELRSLAYSILNISDGKADGDAISTSLPVNVTRSGRRFMVGLDRSRARS